jgi:hypothetical protein
MRRQTVATKRRARSLGAKAAVVTAAAATTVVGLVPAATQPAEAQRAWRGRLSSGQFYAYFCETEYFCSFGGWRPRYGLAEVDSYQAPSNGLWYFVQDRFYARLDGVGTSSVFGGCVFPTNQYVDHRRHGNQSYATHWGYTGWSWIYDSNNSFSAWYTGTYKESMVQNPSLLSNYLIYNYPYVCPVYSPIAQQFQYLP